MVKPLRKVVKVKKHKATFRRHQSDTNVSVPVRCIAAGFPCNARGESLCNVFSCPARLHVRKYVLCRPPPRPAHPAWPLSSPSPRPVEHTDCSKGACHSRPTTC